MPADALPHEQRDRYLSLMREQAQRMQAIVSDLLTLSTLESSPRENGEPIQMKALIGTAVAQAKVLSAQRHTFKEDITPGLRIVGNANELASAISNLLTNAVRYTPQGRSEEHTSELQSLMRISYAVFCLKKKKKQYRI